MNELVFVGLGLHDEMGISLQGLEEVKTANNVFIELYTSLLPNFSIENFQRISGKKLCVISRKELEEESGKEILKTAESGKVVLLVPGDPLVATTHITLRLEAEKKGIKTRVVHGASIISAVVGLSGLHNYKFGKSVTIPFIENFSETPYEVIGQNRKLGLHTLCLLDIQVEKKHYLRIQESLNFLWTIEEKRRRGIVTMKTLAVGIARAGSKNPIIKAGFLKDLLTYDFGDPPHCLIFPGSLHFMEAEALVVLAGAPKAVMEMVE